MHNKIGQTIIPNAWSMPEGLSRLEARLDLKGVDVHSLKSDRQCLRFVTDLAGIRIKWPHRGKSCVPHLVRLQKMLCSDGDGVSANALHHIRKPQPEPFLRSKGAASIVRGVDDAVRREIELRYATPVSEEK